MVKPKSEESYLLGTGEQDDLCRMDELYGRRLEGGGSHLFHKIGDAKLAEYWGVPDDRHPTLFENIGVRGRIWAVCLLLARYGAIFPYDGVATDQILNYAAKTRAQLLNDVSPPAASRLEEQVDSPQPVRSDPQIQKKVHQRLQRLISHASREGFTPVETLSTWLEIVVDYAVDKLFAAQEGAALTAKSFRNAAINRVSSSPSDLYRTLFSEAQVLGPPNAHNRAANRRATAPHPSKEEEALGKHWKARLSTVLKTMRNEVVEGSEKDPIQNYVLPIQADDHDPDVMKIKARLQTMERLIIVTGEPLHGKKTKVKGVLRLLASDSNELLLALRPRGEKIADYLPVLAMSANDGNYRQLVDNVAAFLEAYAKEARTQGYIMSSNGPAYKAETPERRRPTEQFAEAVENIFALYRSYPALFVITDVEAFEYDRTRQAVRDAGIRRLVEAILAANEANRVIITTSDMLPELSGGAPVAGPNDQYLARPRRYEPIVIAAPTVGDMDEYVHEEAWRNVEHAKLVPVNSRLRGDDLVTLAALLSLAYATSGPYRLLTATEYGEIAALLTKPIDDRENERRPIYRMLIGFLRQRNLLHTLALVAASHDGVREDSLIRLLDEWAADWGSDGGAVGRPDDNKPLDQVLEEFAKIAGTRFLRRSQIQRYDPHEYAPEENHSEDDRTWDMDPLVSYWFLEVLADEEPELVAASHRLIARIARRRAQNKKTQMRAALGSRVTEDASRDIQSYASLLASIRFQDVATESVDGPPLRCSEEEIYSVQADRFRPGRALRFAALSLLKEDIDHDHRLTMIFDEDALRLDLYLLLFLELGRPHPTKLRHLKLPSRLPSHLTGGIFHVEEVLDLMSTVALSAYHAQRFQEIADIEHLANQFLAIRPNIVDMPAKLARLWCSRFDAYILLGAPPSGGGHPATLRQLLDLEHTHFAQLRDMDVFDIVKSKPSMELLKGYMRLLARQAEIQGHIAPCGPRVAECYSRIMGLETILSTQLGRHDPLVMSGRVARRYIRHLLSDAQLYCGASSSADNRTLITIPESTLDIVKGLISVNTSRLRRFSGAERVGVMLDLARLAMVEGEFAAQADKIGEAADKFVLACEYANAANRRAFAGSVSHASKLDVLAVQSDVNRRLVEAVLDGIITDLEKADDALTWAGIAAHDLTKMARSLGSMPALGLGQWLEARALITQHRVIEHGGIRYHGKSNPRSLSAAKSLLEEASATMMGVSDATIDSGIMRATNEIKMLETQLRSI